MENNYFIKEGYKHNPDARTFDEQQTGQYWDPERLRLSEIYQYYVYELACNIGKRRRYSSIIDIGCGPGTKARNILSRQFTDITLVDQPSVRDIAKKFMPDSEFIDMDLETCTAAEIAKADMVICIDVLEHLHNPLPCVNMIHKSVKHGGLVIFSTPERDFLRGKECTSSPHPSHVREWNRSEFRSFLEHSGFEVLQHINLPPSRLTPVERIVYACLHHIVPVSRWRACQAAVCRTVP
ncbi:MAG: class I SAM-dependent methyltransferase [Geobacteraceae bacterium]|nr:class I SAM-dependent methyltransferase [Geobacteraceae bacterium]